MVRSELPIHRVHARAAVWLFAGLLCCLAMSVAFFLLRTRQYVVAYAFSNKSDLLAEAWSDGEVRVYHYASGKLAWNVDPGVGTISAIAFSPDDGVIAIGADDSRVAVLDVVTHCVDQLDTLPCGRIAGVGFVQSNRWLLVAGEDNLLLFEESGEQARYVVAEHGLLHRGVFNAFVFLSPSSFVTIGVGDDILLWQGIPPRFRKTKVAESGRTSLNSACRLDKDLLAFRDIDGVIGVLDTSTGRVRREWRVAAPLISPSQIAAMPDGTEIFFGDDGGLRRLDVANGTVVCENLGETAHIDDIVAVQVSPDGKWLAVSYKMRHAGYGKCVKRLTAGGPDSTTTGNTHGWRR